MNAMVEKRKQAQLARLGRLMEMYKRDQARRLAETRKLFRRPVCLVDIHTHSRCSDGQGTVAENAARVRACGLDFFFATDHGSLRQKHAVRHIPYAGWGQEPGLGDCQHHVGLLANTRLFKPRKDAFLADMQRARRLAPFVWTPHPVGWYPATWYSPDKIPLLWQLAPAFAMEVMNGANKIVSAYDEFDRQAVRVWDRLLGDGLSVTAVAGSDAHSPDDIGTAWTGVLGARRSAGSIIRGLNQGRCFASESALLDFTCNGMPMGSRLRARPRAALTFRIRAADAGGLASIRVVSRGRVIREFRPGNRTVADETLVLRAGGRPAYFRLETTACDNRRAFSTPIYVEPGR